jgi:hypothetical protein
MKSVFTVVFVPHHQQRNFLFLPLDLQVVLLKDQLYHQRDLMLS